MERENFYANSEDLESLSRFLWEEGYYVEENLADDSGVILDEYRVIVGTYEVSEKGNLDYVICLEQGKLGHKIGESLFSYGTLDDDLVMVGLVARTY